MNKKTYIVEQNQIRLKPDVEKPELLDFEEKGKGIYFIDHHAYEVALGLYQNILAKQPTYQKQGDWSGYAEGQEISEDEVCFVKQVKVTGFDEATAEQSVSWIEVKEIDIQYAHIVRTVAIPKKKEVDDDDARESVYQMLNKGGYGLTASSAHKLTLDLFKKFKIINHE